LNAFRHGLTGQIVIHTPEDRAAFQQHCDAIREALAPVGALETDLAQAIAEDRWRLNRARALENAIFTLGLQEHSDPNAAHPEVDAAFAQGRTWIAQAKNLQLLTTYEQRIRRSVERTWPSLGIARRAQSRHRASRNRSRLLVQLAEYEGNNYDPADDFPPESQPLGFVFSRSKILREIERDSRLSRARALESRGENLTIVNRPRAPRERTKPLSAVASITPGV